MLKRDPKRCHEVSGVDPTGSYVDFSPQEWQRFVDANPFKCTAAEAAAGGKFFGYYVPMWRKSRDSGSHHFGGFTADMGWPLMVARQALFENQGRDPTLQGVVFQDVWGHGPSDWTDFFEPVTPPECLRADAQKRDVDYRHEGHRHAAKMYHVYDESKPDTYLQRNRRFFEHLGVADRINHDNDLQLAQVLFAWVFRPLPHMRRTIDAAKARVGLPPGPYVGMHVRWGDKVGHGGGPKEALQLPLDDYISDLGCHEPYRAGGPGPPRRLFLATDDFEAFEALRARLGPSWSVYTTAKPANKGFAIDGYRDRSDQDRLDSVVGLWVDMELLAEAEFFVGSIESNVAKTVVLMRKGKHPNMAVNSFDTRIPDRSCCAEGIEVRKRNCMFTCTK